jgi:hypothetical protein
MIDPTHCTSSGKYQPSPVSAAVLALMRRSDEVRLPYPFAEVRMWRDL